MQGLTQIVAQNRIAKATSLGSVKDLIESGLYVVADYTPKGYIASYEVFATKEDALQCSTELLEDLRREILEPVYKTGTAGVPLGIFKSLKEGCYIVSELIDKCIFRNHTAKSLTEANAIVEALPNGRVGLIQSPL
jgi:hypothetical protein